MSDKLPLFYTQVIELVSKAINKVWGVALHVHLVRGYRIIRTQVMLNMLPSRFLFSIMHFLMAKLHVIIESGCQPVLLSVQSMQQC